MSTFKDIFEAATKGTVEDVRFFVEKRGSNIDVKDGDGATPLFCATRYNSNFDVLEYLVSSGADVNSPTHTGRMPIHGAAQGSTVKGVKYLIDNGAKDKVNAKNEKGFTPLHDAAQRNSNVDVLEYLVAEGAEINATTNDGSTPLHCAALSNSNVKMLECLIALGADVNAKDIDGGMPLHSAASQNPSIEVLAYLISHHRSTGKFDINASGPRGMTLLHCAAGANPNVEVLRYLIGQGADVSIRSPDDGQTPLDIATAVSIAFANTPLAVAFAEKKRFLLEVAARNS
jgi:ankyrin repeat protein